MHLFLVVQGLWFVLEYCLRGREGRGFEKYYTGKTVPVLTARTVFMQMCFSFCKTLQFMEKEKLDKPYRAVGLALT